MREDRVQIVRGGRNLLTHHPPESYPGLIVWRGAGWPVGLLVPDDGQTIVALGGEKAYAYETADGGCALGFELLPGDHATLARSGLPFALVEWRIERADETV